MKPPVGGDRCELEASGARSEAAYGWRPVVVEPRDRPSQDYKVECAPGEGTLGEGT